MRPVAPDSNPYMVLFMFLKSGLEGLAASKDQQDEMRTFRERKPIKKLYGTFQDALNGFRASKYMQDTLGEQVHEMYFETKKTVMDRAPKALGEKVKTGEVIFHHEITNQVLWNRF